MHQIMTRITLFADILLPLPLRGTFTYRIPYVLNEAVAVGQRVLVPFGKSRKYAGLIKRVHDIVPQGYQVKYIESIADLRPVVLPSQFRFWEWLASYYMCTEGEVMHAALPHNTREVQDKGWHPQTENFIELSSDYDNEDGLRKLFDHIEKRAPRQLELMVAYVRFSGRYETNPREVSQKVLTESIKGGSAVLSAMIKKGVFQVIKKEQSRFHHQEAVDAPATLNSEQQKALEDIRLGFESRDVVLLHGVTSSGKTELYIQLIREQLSQGKQVLYLLPEIALTTQIIQRLQHQFGSKAGVYHSRFNPMERLEVWNNLLNGGITMNGEHMAYDLVLGPRSALFLPFEKLGLIIVDEEHDPGFKQQDPAPRYHARDAAIYLATMFGAKVLMGSATPSIESYHHALSGKFGMATLKMRHGGVKMPDIRIADIRKETFGKKMKSHLTSLLHREMREALGEKKQVILFQNRRGFSLRLQCELCDWNPVCHQCDVSLVYHKKNNQLKCHYCGYVTAPPNRCPSCESTAIKMRGFGTEKIEEEIPVFFPDAVVARMDLDTTRAKHAYSEIISDFEQRKIDILVGTQMVSKGLDFNNVSLVGILNADNMLGFPDFRAHERAYQLMAQVSGRSGRDKDRGKVVIQTYNPEHLIIKYVIDNDYVAMFEEQLAERRKFHYPPFTRLIRLTLMHKDIKVLDKAAANLAGNLRKEFPKKVLGPEYPLVARVRNLFIKHILVKLDRNQHLNHNRDILLEITERFRENTAFKQLRLVINVDP
jgi:primosomal protein N' (replication factor Y) (superfamily II helicase)